MHIREWWQNGGEATVRHAVEAALTLALAASLWFMIRPWLPIKAAHAANRDSVAASRLDQVAPALRSDIDSLPREHLFGMASPTSIAAAVDPAIQVSGIAYSSDADQSVAILSLNGITAVARKGTVLPDGSIVLAVASDRVTVGRNGQVEDLMLDLKKAALNAHFTPTEFASGSVASGSSSNVTPDLNRPEETPGAAPAAFPSTPVARAPELVMPHFESLQQLRGNRQMQRFQKLKPPVGKIPGQHG